MFSYYQSYDKLKPEDGCKKLPGFVIALLTDFVCLYIYEFWLSLCKIVRSSVILLLSLFVSVLTHGPQLDIDVLKVYNVFARLSHHIISIQKLLVRLISDILIILI